ncbi:MAG TPA: hypothetical protein GXZ64_04365 [Clostridiaceae bacterium]|jgi:predicted small lipoprotein YifL|nr:hypothetical protein [Clostridiaceae bacterium]
MKNSMLILMAVTAILFNTTACSNKEPVAGPGTAEAVTDAQTEAQEAAETETPAAAGYSLLGYTEEVEGVTITLTDFRMSSGDDTYVPEPGHVFLQPQFEIVNNSTKGTAIGMIFTYFVDEEQIPEDVSAIQSAEGEALGTALGFGLTRTGSVGVQAKEDWETLLIRFTPHAVGDSATIVIDRSDLP